MIQPIEDFRDFLTHMAGEGYTQNPCRDHCPDKGTEHAHLHSPDGYDGIIWADGRVSEFDLTQPARLIFPAAPQGRQGRYKLPFRDDGGIRRDPVLHLPVRRMPGRHS
jgi:hypothetical protein